MNSFTLHKKQISFFFFFFQIFISFYSQNKKILSLKEKIKNLKDTILIDAIDELAWEYKPIDSDSAIFYAEKALLLSKKLNIKKSIANSYNTLGSTYENASKLDSALYYYKKSLVVKKDIKDSLGIANTFNNIGIVYDEKGDYLKSITNYFKALSIYEKFDIKDKIAMVYVNIGIVYKKQKKYDRVYDYYLKALNIYKADNNKIGETITTGNIGNLLIFLKKYKQSIQYSKRARDLYDSLNFLRYVPYMDVQIAAANDSLGNLDYSKSLYESSIKTLRQQNSFYEVADVSISFANNYYKSKQYKKSAELLEATLEIIEEKGFRELKINALELLIKSKSKLGLYKSAYLYSKMKNSLKDSVYELKKTKELLNLEAKYQTEKKEKELLQAQANEAKKDLEINKQKQISFGLIGGLLIVVLIGFSIFQRNKKRHQLAIANEKENSLQSIINAEEKERTRIARELHDGIVQQIGAVIINSRNVFDKLGVSKKPESEALINQLENSSSELRSISHQMMPRALEEKGLIIALEELFNNSLQPIQIAYDFEHVNITERLPKRIEVTLYRITQELINNIIKHSKANQVYVQLMKTETAIVFMVEDNGKGFSKTSEKGIGLQNIKSRIDMIQGSVNVNSEQTGTLTTVKIPL